MLLAPSQSFSIVLCSHNPCREYRQVLETQQNDGKSTPKRQDQTPTPTTIIPNAYILVEETKKHVQSRQSASSKGSNCVLIGPGKCNAPEV